MDKIGEKLIDFIFIMFVPIIIVYLTLGSIEIWIKSGFSSNAAWFAAFLIVFACLNVGRTTKEYIQLREKEEKEMKEKKS